MPAFPREEMEEMMRRWKQANKDAEAAGDWKPMAQFYTQDAEYTWNLGPNEDFAAHGRTQIRDWCLGTEGRVEVSAGTTTNRPDEQPAASFSSDSPVAETPRSTGQARSVATPVEAGNRVVMDRTVAPASGSSLPVVTVEPSEIASRLAWRSPRVEFSGAPLAEVVALLNRCNEVKFVIEDPALASMTLSGLFRASDTDAFVRMLEAGFGVQAHRREQQIILRRHP
jgi:hypothetical protein